MYVNAGGSGETWELLPVDDGNVKDGTGGQPDHRLRYVFNTGLWTIGGQEIWTAGNFDPDALNPAQLKSEKVKRKVTLVTSGTSIGLTPHSTGEHYFMVLQHTATITFTLPTGADADLGENYSVSGLLVIENASGAGTVTLVATGADKTEINGVQDSTVGNVQTLAYTIMRVNVSGEKHYVNFSWIS